MCRPKQVTKLRKGKISCCTILLQMVLSENMKEQCLDEGKNH